MEACKKAGWIDYGKQPLRVGPKFRQVVGHVTH